MKKFWLVVLFLFFITVNSSLAVDSGHYRKNDLRELFSKNKAVIYAINIRTFNAKDKNGNEIIEVDKGDIAGNFTNAVDRLNELSDLGINTVELLPITPVGKVKAIGTAGSLFAISDFSSINPQLIDRNSELSAEKQVKTFIKECHNRGLRVMVGLPACGSYDLFIKNPDLFLLDKNSEPIVPYDWTDVRLFKDVNDDGTLNKPLYDAHKKFVDLVQSLGADGIRVSCPSIKSYEFWKSIISYARKKDSQFLFLGDSSPSTDSVSSEYINFTDYKELFDAGFDSYYGEYPEFKNWKSIKDLKRAVKFNNKLFSKYNEPKSVIGAFSTYDDMSPILVGGDKYSSTIMWLNATLPLNPYYIDGFSTGDKYLYSYANKKASKTYTDDDYYYVHKGKMDIFNFSRKPGGGNRLVFQDYFLSLKLRQFASDIILKGNFKTHRSNDPDVFCYSRSYEFKSIIVILNKNLTSKKSAKISIPVSNEIKFVPIKVESSPKIEKGKILVDLFPAEAIVLYTSELKL